ncbi:MAG: hypothetical protein M1825_004078 [Sarcosagium campestre]|nr:MAG: hypothetical protein M1825_004078 [Sarcosagium campestre]
MSAFNALNIIAEAEIEDDLEDTKEIQIEDALKLYQNALRLHAQGRASTNEAVEAYGILFKSEIFSYPEARSAFQASYGWDDDETDSGDQSDDDNPSALSQIVPLAVAQPGSDNLPSTLTRLLYLSYKNYGELLLDCVKYRLTQDLPGQDGDSLPSSDHILPGQASASLVQKALAHFSVALVLDSTDAELWRRTARLCTILGSPRIARFSLEAALDNQENPWALLGLDQTFAAEELRDITKSIDDDLSVPSPSWTLAHQKKLTPSLRRHMNPYPYLTKSTLNLESRNPRYDLLGSRLQVVDISEVSPTWEALFSALRAQIIRAKRGGKVKGRYEDSVCQGYVKICLKGGNGQSIVGNSHATEAQSEREAAVDSVSAQIQGEIAAANEKSPCGGDAVRERADSPEKGSVSTRPEQGLLKTTGEVVPIVNEASEAKATQPPLLRKRTSSSAGVTENAETGRVRSKRIKARETIAETGTREDRSTLEATKLSNHQWTLQMSDQDLFNVVGDLVKPFGVADMGTSTKLVSTFENVINRRDLLAPLDSDKDRSDPLEMAIMDLHAALRCWDERKEGILLRGERAELSGIIAQGKNRSTSHNAALTAFLDHSKEGGRKIPERPVLADEGLVDFVRHSNASQSHMTEVCVAALKALLSPGESSNHHSSSGGNATKPWPSRSSYISHLWSDALKEHVVTLLIEMDSTLYLTAREELLLIQGRSPSRDSFEDSKLVEFIETVFELHLDVYALITNPSSIVDNDTRTAQKDRLGRWAILAHDVIGLHAVTTTDGRPSDDLTLRFLWASATYASMLEGVSREHVVICTADLKVLTRVLGGRSIELCNNAIMPEVSLAAAEREMSRLSTMDLFLAIFEAEETDPLLVIETLEPVLCPENIIWDDAKSSAEDSNSSPQLPMASQRQDLLKFVEQGSTSLRLFLWQSLREAYELIDYPPKVFSCYLKSLDIVVKDFTGPEYHEESPKHRQELTLRCLRTNHELLGRLLQLISKHGPWVFECVDRDHLAHSMATLVDLAKLQHSSTLLEDAIKSGQMQVPQCSSRALLTSYSRAVSKLQAMQIITWTLLYHLLDEGMKQDSDAFPNAAEALSEYVRVVHQATGVREFCGASHKVFLACAMQDHLRRIDHCEIDLIQVVFDLYGLKLASGPFAPIDHGCAPASLDKRSAVALMDLVLKLVGKLNMKDLPKSELRFAVDKIQSVVGVPQDGDAARFNLQLIDRNLRGPIDQNSLHRCLKGEGTISSIPVLRDRALAADKGWFFLLGNLHLSRFRSQKRVSPTTVEDLDLACSFYRRDLQYNTENWETWFRLAQTYDSMIEEDVLWTAARLNYNKAALNLLQRKAINSYIMAVATANRVADPSVDTAEKFSELFSDYGTRLYSSSRPPFNMGAFQLDDFKQFLSGASGVYKGTRYPHTSEELVWKVAKTSFQIAQRYKPEAWINFYMEGKCLWKMLGLPRTTITALEVVDALVNAVSALPKRRNDRQEVTFEPHYKLVAVVHKLVRKELLSPSIGASYLARSVYAVKLKPRPETLADWNAHVLRVLKTLCAADKVNWHHRMIARAADIRYHDYGDQTEAAVAARDELARHMFTKSMVLQVWKPENERPGRHFVFVSKYTCFFVRLLAQLGDRTSIRALAKRVRRRSTEFFRFDQVWSEVCEAYISILRSVGQIPRGYDETTFKPMEREKIFTDARHLENWCHQTSSPPPTLEIFSEVAELRKLNDKCVDPTAIDDLYCDTYAVLFAKMTPMLVAKAELEKSNMMNVNNLLMNSGEKEGIQPPVSRYRLKGIGRKDLLRLADAAISKPQASGNPPARSVGRKPRDAPGGANSTEPTSPLGPRGPNTNPASSVPGSVHDSADDEIEAGEGDDEEEEEEEEEQGEDEAGEEEEEEEEEAGEEEDKQGREDAGKEIEKKVLEVRARSMFPNLTMSAKRINPDNQGGVDG